MEGSKLKILFESLQKEQIRRLARYIQSPLHNKHPNVQLLFLHLRKQLKVKNRDYSNEGLYQVIFPGEAFEAAKIHHIKSYLNQVMADFLAWDDFQQSESVADIHLVRAYAKLGLEKTFRQTVKKTEREIGRSTVQNDRKLRRTFQLKFEEYNFNIRTRGRATDFKLQGLNNALEQSFYAEKLKIACAMISHQAVTKNKYNIGLIAPIIEYLTDHPFLEIPAIGIYYYGWLSLTNPNDDVSAAQLKEMVKKNGAAFPLDELRDIYVLAVNTCIRQINFGKKEFVSETFDLYQSGLELGVFLDKGELSPWTYMNIAVSGLKLKAFDWVHDFIHKYKSYLPENQREGFFNFNLARYYYEQKDYPSAMPLLALQDYQDVLTHLSAKTMLAKMYFELKEFDALDNLLSSLKTFIYRKKLLGYHRDNYLMIISFINKLTGIGGLSRSGKQTLVEEIRASKVSEKEWLLGRVEEN